MSRLTIDGVKRTLDFSGGDGSATFDLAPGALEWQLGIDKDAGITAGTLTFTGQPNGSATSNNVVDSAAAAISVDLTSITPVYLDRFSGTVTVTLASSSGTGNIYITPVGK